ncbi:hypothetical protein V9T40_006614 [Parthenolecanium corni]|uniref:Uncharacterized protein n=1 Tax=Parthenolecanium corni TaxID=536013 RepID=A0AAN9TP40_9HEMI
MKKKKKKKTYTTKKKTHFTEEDVRDCNPPANNTRNAGREDAIIDWPTTRIRSSADPAKETKDKSHYFHPLPSADDLLLGRGTTEAYLRQFGSTRWHFLRNRVTGGHRGEQ